MNAEKILQSNLLDILFENRNKKYGAYVLRGEYNKQLYRALGIIFLITILLLVVSQLRTQVEKIIVYEITGPKLGKISIPDVPKQPIPPKSPAPKKNVVNNKTAMFTSNVVITKDPVNINTLPANLDSMEIGSVPSEGDGKKIIGQGSGPVEVKGGNLIIAAVDKVTPLPFAEVMPEFPGGKNALQQFLEKNLQSPTDIEAGESVTVRIKFIVGYDGILKSFEIVEDGGRIFNNEVIRVLKKMPQWIPGKSRGESVSVYYTIPVKFTAID